MDTHIQGPVNSPSTGAVVSLRGFPIALTDNNTAKSLLTIDASADNPILVEFDGFVETVFNGVVNTITIGTAGSLAAYVASGVILPATLLYTAGKKVLIRARTEVFAMLQTGTKATGTFTPPTSSTATAVINGVSFTATFASNATTTVTNLKVLIVANPTINALVTLSGTTTLIVTANNPGVVGNAITTTSNNANGASWAATTLGSGADSTTGKMEILVRATGLGKGLAIAT